MNCLRLFAATRVALLIQFAAIGADFSGSGILLYREPPATYVELMRYKALQEKPVISNFVLPSGEIRQVRNAAIVARLEHPPTNLSLVSRVKAEETLANIQKLIAAYPQYRVHLNRVATMWQNAIATIKAGAAKAATGSPTTAAPKSALPPLEVNGTIYVQPVLTGFDGLSVSISHDAGAAQVPVEKLTPAQIAALNTTSPSVTITPKSATSKPITTVGEETTGAMETHSSQKTDSFSIHIPPSLAESRYTIALDNVLLANVIARLARTAGDSTLSDANRVTESIKRNRSDLLNSPVVRRAMALNAAVDQLSEAQARSIRVKSLPNLHELLKGHPFTGVLLQGDGGALDSLLQKISIGLVANPFISAEAIEQRAANLSERDIDHCLSMPAFKRIGEMNGRYMRQQMASVIAADSRIMPAVRRAIGGSAGLKKFLDQFATPTEATTRSVILARLETSNFKLSREQQEMFASQLARQVELYLSNLSNLAGFGFKSVVDVEVAFAASSKPVVEELKEVRRAFLERMEKESDSFQKE